MLAPPYDWHLTHAAWNLQRRIEHGNTATPTLARALRNKHRVAIWCSPEPDEDFPQGWYTAKIIDPQTENHNQHLVQYDADGSTRLHTFMPVAGHTASGGRDRWTPAPPPEAPPCPACGSATKGGTGAGGTATYPYTPYHAKVARLAYTCVRCDSKCSAKNPATLARADPSSPRITEPLDCRPTPPRAPKPPPPQPPAGARQSPRLAALAALAPDADGHAAAPAQTAQARAHPPPAPPPRTANYRDHTDPRPCVADATLTYHNANGLAALGAGAAYLRDVALRLSDVHAVSETSWTDGQIDALQAKMKDEGHRLWAVAAKTRRTAKSGTAILAKATIAPRPGDGLVWAKPDGKAMAVALTIGDRPVYLLAAHLPHTDPERVAFLTTVADGVRAATAAHAQTPEGRPWARATHLWAADLNLTCNPTLDNETRRPGPTPEVARALDHLSQATGGTTDAYRRINPQGTAYTHGSVEKAGSRRRLDAWFAPESLLVGPTGVVSTRRVDREAAAFSYVDAHTRKERHKQSDHDAVQITLRDTPIPRPQPRSTLKPSTLRHPQVRAAMRQLLASTPSLGPGSADTLWTRVLEIGLAHQRSQAKERAKRRAGTLKHIRRLQEKVSRTQNEAAKARSLHALRRQQAKLQKQNHRERRERDAQAEHEAQMAATGQGKAAKPWAPHQPITRVAEPSTCAVRAATTVASDGRVQLQLATAVTPGQEHTDQQSIEASVAAFWRDLLNNVHTPSEQAQRDKTGVLRRLQAATVNLLSEEVREGLKTANLVHPENIAVAIRSLSRGSTPGEDDMSLDFFLAHIDLVAPLLSKLFARVLVTGKMTPTMCRAILSPLYKNKGSPHDRAMYRPVSVTTIPYRILAKCIAQKLNAAIPQLVGDPQTGYVVGRTYDENVRIVRQTAHDINHHRPHDGGVMLMLDNAKAFDRLQHEFALDVLRAFNLPPSLISAVKMLYNGAETRVKINGHLAPPFPNTSGVKQGCPLSGLLYILVQEVQLRMIREDVGIRGIPIPGPDGELTPAPAATRLAPPPHALKERGLVDDTMIALASSESIPPLLRVLDRFEAMSNHRMNISKTMMLLLGSERGFDLHAGTPAARALRRRGLRRTYDITPGQDDTLPDKWHGIILGNEQGVTGAWECTAAQAGAAADSLHACPIPLGSRGRVSLAQHMISRAFATLRLTAPTDQRAVDATLGAIQKHANGLVFGRRWWLTEKAATQPRSALGVGHLHAANYMQAAWAQPLLDAMGRTTEDRPYKHYFAHYARRAYPDLGMGRELLSLKTSVLDLVTDVPVLVTDCRNGCLDVSIGRCESA